MRAPVPLPPYAYRDDANVPDFPDERPLIVIDGDCAMCASDARFVLRNDARRLFRLAVAQSALGRALYAHWGLSYGETGTFLLVQDGRVFTESDGALHVLARLRFPWPAIAALLRLVPRAWRDGFYRLIARKRYVWWGRNEVCYAPGPGDAERFLS